MGKIKINTIWERYRSSKLQTKLGIAFSVLAVLISAALTFILYLNFRTKIFKDAREEVCYMASVAALQVDSDLHATLTDPAQEGNPAYMQIKRTLQHIRDSVPDLRFVYTWRRTADGKLIFVVDAETDPNQMSHLGDVYTSGEPALLAKLARLDHPVADDKLNADKGGVFLSGYAPFYKSNGQMEGILGMDIKASDVVANERLFLWISLAVFAATVPLTVLLGMWFGRKLAAPVVKLTLGSERIAQGDLGHRVSVHGSFETNILTKSFNKMTETLQKAIIYRDEEINNRKRAESALDAANKNLQATVRHLDLANRQLRSFAYITSHDLKTPLRGIKVLADWLVSDYADKFDDRGRERIDLLSKRVTRMHNFIEAINDYTSVGYVKDNKITIDLNELVVDIIHNLNLPENIEIKIENELPVIKFGKNHIGRVFLNLLDNAVRFMDKPHGRITVGCTRLGGCWQFSVADNGPGIYEKYHDKIFEIFQTLSTRDEYENTGIGLSIVQKILELYNGVIWVESEPGKGSTFFFTLPVKGVESIADQTLCAADA